MAREKRMTNARMYCEGEKTGTGGRVVIKADGSYMTRAWSYAKFMIS
jgi:hypothetical protein